MLKSLEIKNFALVESLYIEFGAGLNILTGETGAGKTIIVNAIAQLFGERSSVELVRSGAKKAVIEAVLELDPSADFIKRVRELELDIELNSQLIIRKEISATGSTRIFVNDSPLTLNSLNRLSDLLLDLHGQHQHQRLLYPENHLSYLDAFGGLNDDAVAFEEMFHQYKSELQELHSLKERQLKARQKQDMYRFQVGELSKAEPKEGELEELKKELRLLTNVELLHQYSAHLSQELYSGETNASQILSRCEDDLKELSGLDEQFSALLRSIAEARETIEEVGRFAESYISGLQFDPQRMEFIHQRIAQLEFLLKKYQVASLEELLDLEKKIKEELKDSEQYDEAIREKDKRVTALQMEITHRAVELSERRKKAAGEFNRKIMSVLAEVGMPRARFRVILKTEENGKSAFIVDGKAVTMDKHGFDRVFFEMSTNGDGNYKALHKIVSGGELSRIMLALKSALAENDQIPTLVFDEIDAGISGKVAQIVGHKIANLSTYHQILCVTHLPQIAAFADRHYKVNKITEDNGSFVDIQLLNEQGKINELANLLAGKNISQQAMENAEQLIHEANTLRG